MTIFGPDISSYQNGLYLANLRDASFVIAKTTEGLSYIDPDYQSWRRQAQAAQTPFAWYHFLTGADAQSQVNNTRANVGDLSLPGMLDVEPEGSYSPTMEQILAYVDAAHTAGLKLRLLYLPEWFHRQMGSPDLTPLKDRGLLLVSSGYPGGAGTAPQIYAQAGGDKASGWGGYGNMYPFIYQFTNQALDGGQRIDYNACRATRDQLVAALGAPVPTTTPTPGGPEVTYTVTAGWENDYPDAAAELQKYAPVGTNMDAEEAAAYSAMRGIVAVYRAGQIESKLDQVLATLNPATLGAAVASHISGGGAVDEAALTQFIAGHLKIGLSEQ